MAYGINSPLSGIDLMGAAWTTEDMYQYYLNGNGNALTLGQMGLKGAIWGALNSSYQRNWESGGEWWRNVYLPYSEGSGNNPTGFMDRMKEQIRSIGVSMIGRSSPSGASSFSYNFSNGYNFAPIVWALGGGSIYVNRSAYTVDWYDGGDGFIYYTITGTYNLHYHDDFSEPVDIPGLEWGTPYAYYDSWLSQSVFLEGRIAE